MALVVPLLLLTCVISYAQDSIPTLEFNIRPYYLQNGEPQNFEKVKGQVDTKAHGLYGGASLYYMTFGAQSDVRFPADNVPRIVIKFDPAETFGMKLDPMETLSISKAVQGKGKKDKERRLFEQVSVAHFGRTKDISENQVNFEVKKLSDVVYEIVFPDGLPAGEYAIMESINLYCFGIDE